MKQLILMRHAKSSWDDAEARDIDRKLSERGIDAAAWMGKWMADEGLIPDHAIVSNAARCAETWEIVAKCFPAPPPVHFEPRLYSAAPEDMLAVIRETAIGDRVLILGHQPTIGAMASAMRVDPPPAHETFKKYPTAATTVLDLPVDEWSNASFGSAELNRYMTPNRIA